MTSWGNLQPLSTEFYSLLRYGFFLVLFPPLPFVGCIIGGSAVSLLLSFLGKEKRDPAYLRFSKELMETVMIRRWPLFMFGIVPLLLVWFAYARILFDSTPLSWYLWSAILVVLFAGFSLLHRYRSHGHRATDPRPLPIGIGAAGLLAVVLACFLFSNVYGILFNPEKLPLLRKQIGFLLSWNAVVKFLLFLAFFFGMTGGGSLLLGGRSPGGGVGADGGYRGVVRGGGARLTLSPPLVLPGFL